MKEVNQILEDFPTPDDEAPDDGDLLANLVIVKSAILNGQKKGQIPPYDWDGPALTFKSVKMLNEALKPKGWMLIGRLINALPKETPTYGGVPAPQPVSPPFDHFGHPPRGPEDLFRLRTGLQLSARQLSELP